MSEHLNESEEQIFPCPFCGGKEIDAGEVWDGPGGYVRCKCGGMMQKIGESLKIAITAWNAAYMMRHGK